MKFSHLLLLAAGTPLFAFAQTDQAMPAAADPKAPVPPLHYHSVFEDYVGAETPSRSPDKAWVSANRAVMGAEGESEPHQVPDRHEHGGARQ